VSHAKKQINLTTRQIGEVIDTLTEERMQKYIFAAKNDKRIALALYSHNSKISASMMIDLHYLEIALRNSFDKQLTTIHSVPSTPTTPSVEWFDNPVFLNIICPLNAAGYPVDSSNKTRTIINAAKRSAAKGLPHGSSIPHGKIVAELTFGFWHRLTNKALEHSLWVQCLSASFFSKAPKRSTLHNQLETIRLLRNRIAHHEPVIFSPLQANQDIAIEIISQICPITTKYLKDTSTFKQELAAINTFKRRKCL
jgi:hypothetical protein